MMNAVKDDLDAHVNCANAGDHVPKAEQNNCTLKEDARSILSHAFQGDAASDDAALGDGMHDWAELFPCEGRGFKALQSKNDVESDQFGL